MYNLAVDDIVSFGKGLDTQLSGEAYLRGRQKQLLDHYGAKVLRPLATPIVNLARLAVLADQGSPTMVKLQRVGQYGVPFEQLKIRTMVRGAEKQLTPLRNKDARDERITNIGKYLRCYSIDELPQITNVLNGDMSLVGPRPKSISEFGAFTKLRPDFEPAYKSAQPGMTGIEQVNGRGELTPQERAEYAVQYAAEACLKLDLDILLKTAKVVKCHEGAF